MFFDSSESLERTHSMMDAISFARAKDLYQPSLGETASASMGTAWDRTMGVRWYENWQIGKAEKEALDAGTTLIYANEEEFKASEYYAPGMEFQEGMTATRARMMRENYDERRRREWILNSADNNGTPWLYMPVSFGAGIIGSFPDPVNALSALFPGAAPARAALAGMTGKQVFKQSLTPGVLGAAAGTNLVSSAYAAWDLNPKGEHIGFTDVMMDTMMGAVLGPMFHAGGTLFARSRVRRGVRNIAGDLHAGHPVGRELENLISRMQKNDPEAYRAYGYKLQEWTNTQTRNHEALDFVRNRIKAGDRAEIARWMEFALTETAAARPVDMAQVMTSSQGMPVLKRIESLVNEYRKQQNEAPVVVNSVDAARAEITSMNKAIAALDDEWSKAIRMTERERGSLYEITRARESIESARNALDTLIDLQNRKETTVADLQATRDQLARTRAETQNFAEAMGLRGREAGRVGEVPIQRLTRAIADMEAKLAEIESSSLDQLGDITPSSAEKIVYQKVEVPDPVNVEPLRTTDAVTRAEEYREQGIDSNGISDIEYELGPLTPEEQIMLDQHALEGRRINAQEQAINDSSFLECLLSAGALR